MKGCIGNPYSPVREWLRTPRENRRCHQQAQEARHYQMSKMTITQIRQLNKCVNTS